jgi:hypothetical protein
MSPSDVLENFRAALRTWVDPYVRGTAVPDLPSDELKKQARAIAVLMKKHHLKPYPLLEMLQQHDFRLLDRASIELDLLRGILAADPPKGKTAGRKKRRKPASARKLTGRQAEIVQVLAECEGEVKKAAERLGCTDENIR